MRDLCSLKAYLANERRSAFWGMIAITASYLILFGQSATAEGCRMAMAWSSEGQFIRNTECEYLPVPPLDGTDWISGTLSQKYEYRVDARFEVTAHTIVAYIGRVCEIGGQPLVIAQAKAVETANTRSVFFSCLPNPNEVPK